MELKYNQIKTKEDLDDWVKKKKEKLDKQMIILFDSFYADKKRLEEKYISKLKELKKLK